MNAARRPSPVPVPNPDPKGLRRIASAAEAFRALAQQMGEGDLTAPVTIADFREHILAVADCFEALGTELAAESPALRAVS